MKVKVVRRDYPEKGKFTIELNQGPQFFYLDYTGTEEECRWMVRMCKIALAKHDEEQYNKIDWDDV